MSSIHSTQRRLRHLREITCRGLSYADVNGCYFVLTPTDIDSDYNNNGDNEFEEGYGASYRSEVCLDSHNPSWEPLPLSFIEEHTGVTIAKLVVYGASNDDAVIEKTVDMRTAQYISKTIAALPSLRGPKVLLRCQDGVYDVDASPDADKDDEQGWVIVKDNIMTTRTDKLRIDSLQSWGIAFTTLSIEYDLLRGRYDAIALAVNEGVQRASSPLSDSNCIVNHNNNNTDDGKENIKEETGDVREALEQQDAIIMRLQQAISLRKAAHERRLLTLQQHRRRIESCCELYNNKRHGSGLSPNPSPRGSVGVNNSNDVNNINENFNSSQVPNDYSLTSDLPTLHVQAQKQQFKLLAGIADHFHVSVRDGTVNSARLPESCPEQLTHGVALGHVAHLLCVLAGIFDFTLPRPVVVCGGRSRIGERLGLLPDAYLPLYASKSHDRLQMRRAVELLKDNIQTSLQSLFGVMDVTEATSTIVMVDLLLVRVKQYEKEQTKIQAQLQQSALIPEPVATSS